MKYILIVFSFIVCSSCYGQNQAKKENLIKVEKNNEVYLQIKTDSDKLVELVIPNKKSVQEFVYLDDDYALHISWISENLFFISAAYYLDKEWIQDYKYSTFQFAISGLNQTSIKNVKIIDGQSFEVHLENHNNKGIQYEYSKKYSLDKFGIYDTETEGYKSMSFSKVIMNGDKCPRPNHSKFK